MIKFVIFFIKDNLVQFFFTNYQDSFKSRPYQKFFEIDVLAIKRNNKYLRRSSVQHHQRYKNPPANSYNRLHEIKTKSRKLNSHQDVSNNSATTRYYQVKESTNQEITNFIQHFTPSRQWYNCSSWQRKHWNVRRSQITQTKSEEISSPSKIFHGAPFS